MLIICGKPYECGSRPPMQSWQGNTIPDGYAIVPDYVATSVFYDYNGFVNLTVENGIVLEMTPNIEAWEAWKASLPEPDQEPLDEITALQLAVTELAETQENYQTANELALAELAELLIGGI